MSNGSTTNNAIDIPSMQEIANKWTSIAKTRLEANIRKLKIIDTSTLVNSLEGQVIIANDKTLRFRFTYRQYGQYVDMGVGKGVSRGARGTAAFTKNRNEKGQLLRYKRKARPWYSKAMFKETVILGNIVAQNIAERTGQLVYQLPKKIEM